MHRARSGLQCPPRCSTVPMQTVRIPARAGANIREGIRGAGHRASVIVSGAQG